MREWPSIVPGTPADYYIVSPLWPGPAPRSQKPTSTTPNYETTIADA